MYLLFQDDERNSPVDTGIGSADRQPSGPPDTFHPGQEPPLEREKAAAEEMADKEHHEDGEDFSYPDEEGAQEGNLSPPAGEGQALEETGDDSNIEQ